MVALYFFHKPYYFYYATSYTTRSHKKATNALQHNWLYELILRKDMPHGVSGIANKHVPLSLSL